MANWNTILDELKTKNNRFDEVRRNYLKELSELTERNVIIYYSGWLKKGELRNHGVNGFNINDNDKNGFMSTIHKLDTDKGLDLLLHTPGGSMAATESLVDYLRSIFGNNIRAFVPQLAMSGGTMISCACKEIYMGKQSSIGPIDPQINGLPAHGIIEEFEQARKDIKQNKANIPLWQPIINKYNPTLIGECQKALKWSKTMVKKWLKTGMFEGEDAEDKIDAIIKELSDHALNKSHNRHISLERAKEMGLKVKELENDDELQDKVLTVHHSTMLTLTHKPVIKIIENHKGVANITSINVKAIKNN